MKITKKIGLLLISIMLFTSAVVVWGYGTAEAPIRLTSSNRNIQYYKINANNSWQALTKDSNYYVMRTRMNDDFVVECQKNELTNLCSYYRAVVEYKGEIYPVTYAAKVVGNGSNTSSYYNIALSNQPLTMEVMVEPWLYSSYRNEGCWSPNMYK